VGYIVKVYIEYFNASQFTKYPPQIATSLRRALYYSNIKPDPKLALKYYKQALEQCAELGLDPYSDDVLGIRIQTAAWLEKIGNYQNSITVLDGIFNDCINWIGWMEKGIAAGTLDKAGKPPMPLNPPLEAGEDAKEEEVKIEPENLWHQRTRLLAKAVGISVKLGQLHSDEHVMESDKAQTRLTWAVETTLSELQRRSSRGVQGEEGSWMSAEEIGGAIEGKAAHYSLHHVAASANCAAFPGRSLSNLANHIYTCSSR
jgi:hypothetical protein